MRLFFLLLFCLSLSVTGKEILILSGADDSMVELNTILLKKAYEKLGIEIVTKTYPAARALVEANQGRTDGEICRTKGIDKTFRNLKMIPSSIISLDGLVYTVNAKLPKVTWSSLKPYSIGILRGVKYLEKMTKGLKVTSFNSAEQMFKLVDIGRYDLCISSDLNGQTIIRKLGLKNVKPLYPALIDKQIFHYLHKKHAHLVPKITLILQKMKQSGELEEIKRAYFESKRI